MKEYTIVYSTYHQMGSHTNSLTHLKRVTKRAKETFEEMLERVDIDSTQIWAVLPGHQFPLEDWSQA